MKYEVGFAQTTTVSLCSKLNLLVFQSWLKNTSFSESDKD